MERDYEGVQMLQVEKHFILEEAKTFFLTFFLKAHAGLPVQFPCCPITYEGSCFLPLPALALCYEFDK